MYTVFRLSLPHGWPAQQLLALVSSRDRELWSMTLTFELDPDNVKLNQHAKHLGQRLWSSKVIVRTYRHTRIVPIALPGPLDGNKRSRYVNLVLLRSILLANVNSRSRSLYAIARPSVVCLSSVTLVHPTQPIVIFGNISMALGTLAIRWHPLKISRRSSHGNPSAGGVKHKRGSKI